MGGPRVLSQGRPTITIHDMDAIGMGDVWFVQGDGVAHKIGGFDHALGLKLVESLRMWCPEGGSLVYDVHTSHHWLELILH